MPEFDPAKIKDYGTYLGAEAAYNLEDIQDYAVEHALRTDYIGGLGGYILEPFVKSITDTAKPAVDEVFDLAQARLGNLGDAFIDASGVLAETEDGNADLFERFRLGDDDPGDSAGRDAYSGDGMAFPIAELDLPAPPASENGNNDLDLKGMANIIENVVDWVIEKSIELGSTLGVDSPFQEGDSFESIVIDPILGDFGAINSYGEAWQTVFVNGLGQTVTQMGTNLTALVGSEVHADNGQTYWTGDGAAAAKAFVDEYWTTGVQTVAEFIGTRILAGFKAISEALSSLASKLVNEVADLITHIGTQVTKMMLKANPVGAVEEGARILVNTVWGLAGDKEEADRKIPTVITKVQKAVGLINAVLEAYRSMREIAATAQDYLQLINDLSDAFKQFPEVRDIESAGALATKVGEAGSNPQLPDNDSRAMFEKIKETGPKVEDVGRKLNDSEEKLDQVDDLYPEDSRSESTDPWDKFVHSEEGHWEEQQSYTDKDGVKFRVYHDFSTGLGVFVPADATYEEQVEAFQEQMELKSGLVPEGAK